MKKKNNQGFTLLEMLVVLLVITVLLLLFVPNLSKQSKNINKQGDQALEKVIETQCEMYYLDNQVYPKTLDELAQGGYISDGQLKKAKDLEITIGN